jgi:membrane protein DedA with SNARE-associated domain
VGSILDFFQHLPEHVLALDPLWLVVVCGLLVFLEDAIFIGFVVPGESAAVVAGVASSIAGVSFPVAIVVIVLAAVIGDTVGYEVGRHFFGPTLLERGFLAKHRHRIAGAEDFLRRRGGIAVFLGRFTAFFRAMLPALAGAARMPYPVFLRWNALGGILWGTGFVVLGHLAGASYATIQAKVGHDAAYVVGGIVVLALLVWRIREHRKGAGEERTDDERPAEGRSGG